MPRILVVEDSTDIRFIIREILKRNGYECVEAENGIQALDLIERDGRFDLVITDVRMAKMTGLELLGEIQQRFPSLPAIVLSVHTIPEWIEEAMQKGALTYLAKPFTPEQLMAAIEHSLISSPL
jgi:DNA-binding NtrC family response regulator